MGTMPMVLGQQAAIRPSPAVPTSSSMPSRVTVISRQEAEMVLRIVQSVLNFQKGFPLEFYAYCPPDRWKPVLEKVAAGVDDIQRQLKTNATQISTSADVLFAVTDLEECVSGSRDARLSSAKTAMFISAGAAIGETLFGLSWLGLPAYIISLAIVLGRPLLERVKEVPAEPFRVDSMGLSNSGHENALWVEYTGPSTGGLSRKAGPFMSQGDAVKHAVRNGGFSQPGLDGFYFVYDQDGNVLEKAA